MGNYLKVVFDAWQKQEAVYKYLLIVKTRETALQTYATTVYLIQLSTIKLSLQAINEQTCAEM